MPTPLHSRIAALVPSLTGWCSVEKANDLALAIIKIRSSVTVEIGVWGGRSLIPMALAHREQAHGVVWAIDPWSAKASVEGYDKANSDWWGAQDHDLVYRNFLANLKANAVEEYVRVVRMKSDDVEPPENIGLLHLDGQHTDQTIRDVERFASKVIPNGFCFVDDIHWSGGGVERGVEKLLTLGFVKLFVRDTGAMFQRIAVKKPEAKPAPVKVEKAKNPRKRQRFRVATRKPQLEAAVA